MLITILLNRNQAAVRRSVVGMKTPLHSPLRPDGDINVSMVKLISYFSDRSIAIAAVPDVGLSRLSLIAQTMTLKSQHQDQAFKDNPS